MVIKPNFDKAENFSGGLARVVVLGNRKVVEHGVQYRAPKFEYINKTGKYVWKPSY